MTWVTSLDELWPRRRVRVRPVITVAALGALAWWALAPLPPVADDPSAIEPRPSEPSSAAGPPRLALDLAAFHAPLWVAPPAPPAPPQPAPKEKTSPPLPPLRLQILAIVTDSGGRRALLYDPETDKPIWVCAGQPVGTRTVEAVTAEGVDLREGTLLRTLALRTDAPGGSVLEQSLRKREEHP